MTAIDALAIRARAEFLRTHAVGVKRVLMGSHLVDENVLDAMANAPGDLLALIADNDALRERVAALTAERDAARGQLMQVATDWHYLKESDGKWQWANDTWCDDSDVGRPYDTAEAALAAYLDPATSDAATDAWYPHMDERNGADDGGGDGE